MDPITTTHQFQVSIDSTNLGMWTECSGIEAQYDIEEYVEGGQNFFTHKLPGRIKYGNITLKRAIDGRSGEVAAWFNSVLLQSASRTTGSITLLGEDHEQLARWSISDVIPVKWSGPSLDADKGIIAEESLELAHHGFVFEAF